MRRLLFLAIALIISATVMSVVSFADDNTKYVSSLSDINNAINEPFADGEATRTIVLESDLVIQPKPKSSRDKSDCIVFSTEGNYIFDLNGHTITKEYPNEEYRDNEPVVDISEKDAHITITGNGMIICPENGSFEHAINNFGSLTIENGTYEAFTAVCNFEKCTINNGTFIGYNTIDNYLGGDLIINNGVFQSKSFGHSNSHSCVFDSNDYDKNNGTVIRGGLFDSIGSSSGVVSYGKVLIEGGTFKGTSAFSPLAYINEYCIDKKLEISGGDFTGCAIFFTWSNMIFDNDHLIVKGAKLTSEQKTEILNVISRGDAAKKAMKKATPQRARISNVAMVKKGFRITLKRMKNAETYQVSYRLKNTKKWKLITIAKAKTTVKNLKPKKKYQIRVRGVGKYGEYILYGPWSAVKTIKVK